MKEMKEQVMRPSGEKTCGDASHCLRDTEIGGASAQLTA